MIELSLITPVYNGEKILRDTLEKLSDFLRANSDVELILVNDGSTDNSKKILEEFLKNNERTEIVNLENNQGKGKALKAGSKMAQGRFIGFTDADLPYGLKIINSMCKELRENSSVSLLFGSRGNKYSKFSNYGLLRKGGRLFFSWIIRILVLPDISDTQCGVKVMKKELAKLVAEKSTINRFAFDIELFVITKINGLFYKDFPVELQNQKESSVRILNDTLLMLLDIWRIRKNIKNKIYIS